MNGAFSRVSSYLYRGLYGHDESGNTERAERARKARKNKTKTASGAR